MIAVIVSVKMKVSEHDMVAANTVTVESDIDDSSEYIHVPKFISYIPVLNSALQV